MSLSHRKAFARSGLNYDLPTLPFLSTMLGLMSIMALTTLGLTAEKRQEVQKVKGVQLVDIPTEFRPFHVRCMPKAIAWLDDSGSWNDVDLVSLITLLRPGMGNAMIDAKARDMIRFLRAKTLANSNLSFSGQQNTLILWVEPDGVEAASIIQYIVNQMQLPLRIGKLPIFPGEEIKPNAPLPK